VRTFVNLLLHTGCDLGDGILYTPDNLEIVKIDKRKTVHVYRYKRRKTGVDAVVPLADWIIDDLMKVSPLKKSRPGLPFRTDTEADIRWDVKVRVIKKVWRRVGGAADAR
jgi:hypothetical protein